ncbi:tetratricopeptide repeat protein [Clostridium homopropionicum DSM 5847]|uniref:Tetratricopeptide repeat protein n=2 Tax=Clostridium TaxID=1485 RepID=A0A0L6Z7Q3_9CLOT|nr:tetratricopeptide repeat protein [Clostridium homopropionicum]KOA18994.1 tetratricopeptide repeat protein [Clostridium homopropionicum DSM 5847]SFG42311.1 TPR repeat-containing protein [Clostridium homopropionicum]
MYTNYYDYYYLGSAYAELGQYEDALDTFTTALEIADTDETISLESISTVFKKRGEMYILLNDFESALYFDENNQEALDYYNFLTEKLNMSI